MPHIILEYSHETMTDDVLAHMLDRLFEVVVNSGLFDSSNIKLRGVPVKHYRLGSAKQGFIHVQCRIHQGRSPEQKQLLCSGIVAALKAGNTAVSVITCEVVEMERECYAKWSL